MPGETRSSGWLRWSATYIRTPHQVVLRHLQWAGSSSSTARVHRYATAMTRPWQKADMGRLAGSDRNDAQQTGETAKDSSDQRCKRQIQDQPASSDRGEVPVK